MKRVLLIGKFNQAVRNLNECLADAFRVQVCTEDTAMIREMIKIAKPELAILSLIDFSGDEQSVFELFANSLRKIPVVVIGNNEECSKFEKYLEYEPFVKLIRPVNKELLLKKCREVLGMEDEEALDGNKSKAVQDGKTAKTGKKNILVVDDSALALRSIKAMLGDKYKITVATSAKRGMDAIKTKRPDLILLDYDMPGCDGREMLKMIRQDDELADIPVIFLTAVADKEHIMAVLQLNPNGYFRKPLEQNMVLKAIADILGE